CPNDPPFHKLRRRYGKFYNCFYASCFLFLLLKSNQLFRRILFRGKYSIHNRCNKHYTTNIKRKFYRLRNNPFGGCICYTKPVSENIRKCRCNNCSGTDKETLHSKPHGSLI